MKWSAGNGRTNQLVFAAAPLTPQMLRQGWAALHPMAPPREKEAGYFLSYFLHLVRPRGEKDTGIRTGLPSPVRIWRSYRISEKPFSTTFGRFYHSCAAMVNTNVAVFQSSLSQPRLGFSDVWPSYMQDCDFPFVFSDKADGLAFNTNSLTDFRTSLDDYNLRFNILAADISPFV